MLIKESLAVNENGWLYCEAMVGSLTMAGGELMVTAQGLFNSGITWDHIRKTLHRPDVTIMEVANVLRTEIPLLDIEKYVAIRTVLDEEAERLFALAQQRGPVSNLNIQRFQGPTKERTLSIYHQCHSQISDALSDFFVSIPESIFSRVILREGSAGVLKEDAVILTSHEKLDFLEACLCLLAEAYTASELSSFRVAESLLRRWYQAKTGKVVERSMGAVLNELESRYPLGKRPNELALLDYLTKLRNEIDHPQRDGQLGSAEYALMQIKHLVKVIKPHLELAKQSEPDSNES